MKHVSFCDCVNTINTNPTRNKTPSLKIVDKPYTLYFAIVMASIVAVEKIRTKPIKKCGTYGFWNLRSLPENNNIAYSKPRR